jgi:uncharacterized membrane protein YjgN (DUF898 family)
VTAVVPEHSIAALDRTRDDMRTLPGKAGGASVAAASFDGSGGEFVKLLLKGSVLLIPTLGFYRFWLITDIRRHLWSHTRVGNDHLEYTGSGKELLIGFLIALAVLVPIYVAYFIAGLMAETLQAFASLPLAAFLYGFGQYALFRSRRYRATRTVLRGLRFWMTGSPWAYAGRALVWDLATVLTIGLLYPWRSAALERYKMRHTHFGDLAGDFVSTGGMLFKRGWWLWLVALVVPLSLVAGTVALGMGLSGAAAPVYVVLLSAVLGIALGIIAMVVFGLLRGIQLRWYLEGIRFGAVEVASHLRKGQVFGCYVKALLAAVVYGIVAVALMTGLVFVFSEPLSTLKAGESWSAGTIAAFASLAVAYLAFVIGLGLLKRYFVDRGVWRAAAASALVVNVAALDAVVARGDVAGSLGEGLADALDFGGF